MAGIFNFLRSDLFLSLLGGFVLGIVGLTLIKPAVANHTAAKAAHSITIDAS